MDKLFNKNWFIKLSSLVIAVMLFLMVNMNTTQNQPGGLPGITDGSRTMEDVELTVYYDEENYVLTEAPETVQVTLRGPQNVINMAQVTQHQQEVYIDLEDNEAGVHYEQVQYSGFPADVSVSISPATVRVALQERQTASFPVEIDLENEGEMTEGYVAGSPEANPSTVDVTAAQGIIEQIASARAVVDLSERDESFEESVQIIFYDESGNEMDLNANPPAVEVTVPITSPNKEVPLRLGRTGTLPEGVAIDSVNTEPEFVTVFGPVEVINDITFIDLPDLNLDDITGDTALEVEVPVPDGAERVAPETVTVEVEATEEEERTFSDFEIDVEGIDDDHTLEFISPEDGVFDLVVSGSPDVLERLERSELEARLEVDGLGEGEHEAELVIAGPQNIRFDQQGMDVSFIVSENNGTPVETQNENADEDDNDNEDENVENENNNSGNEADNNTDNNENDDTS